MITQALVMEYFDYRAGELYWKKRSANRTKIGSKADFVENTGYVRVKLKGKLYGAHQIIFLLHHGYLPEFIDHIDSDRRNNRIENLRPATKSQNAYNKKVRRDSRAGVKNVSWYESLGAWLVTVTVNKKRRHLGYFKDLELAEFVAYEAREKFHGAFANHGVLA